MLLEQEKPIITSLLWTDLYKLTMGHAVFHQYPEVAARYEFINRGKTSFPDGFAYKIREQVSRMSELELLDEELEFLEEKCPFLKKDYRRYFAGFHFDPKEVQVEQTGGELHIDIEGPWQRTIYWEVPIMTLISELYFKETRQLPTSKFIERAEEKGKVMKAEGALLLEFGTRRAYSQYIHRNVLGALIKTGKPATEGGILLGTSNVRLAFEYGIPASGTYAHEWVQAHAAMYDNTMANKKAMEAWAREYLGLDGNTAYPQLGTALMDTYTTDVFLHTFNEYWAQYYTYLRQDSGNPFVEGAKAVNRLEELGINPKTKGIVFSDGLDIPKALKIHECFKNQTKVVFGIGTDLTNDVGVKPLNIVIKAFAFRMPSGLWVPVAKLSDDRGKESGPPEAVEQAKKDFELI